MTISKLGVDPHPRCVVCGARDPLGLGLHFTSGEDGSVESGFRCDSELEGYPGQLHGGMIALLLDAAMTHCLFSRGRRAVTAELTVRYREPVATDRPASVRARIEGSRHRLSVVKAELLQGGRARAWATAKFVDRPEVAARRSGSGGAIRRGPEAKPTRGRGSPPGPR
jgi:uncharacterized protein (TIGR00369 family)